MHKILFLALLSLILIRNSLINQNPKVLGISTVSAESPSLVLEKTQLITTTAFEQKIVEEKEEIPYEIKYEKDNDMDYGTTETRQTGKNGLKTYYYLVTHWQDEEIDRILKETQTTQPTEEIIAQGTKITWRLLEGTEHGRLKYWHKMKVWATKYDANCIGCTGRTYSGTEVKKGVCATDPKVIPLGTNFYVEGYGLCRAEDIGGAIKGDKIDLGYIDASKGEWRTGFTTIYLLTNAPE